MMTGHWCCAHCCCPLVCHSHGHRNAMCDGVQDSIDDNDVHDEDDYCSEDHVSYAHGLLEAVTQTNMLG